MEIKFTKEQYRHLLELLYLGEWTANSPKTAENRIFEYDEIYRYITSFAKEFGCGDLFAFDEELGGYAETKEYEERMQKHVQEYDEEVFWGELSSRMAQQDTIKELGDSAPIEEYLPMMFDKEEQYEEEFEKNGINNLILKKDTE